MTKTGSLIPLVLAAGAAAASLPAQAADVTLYGILDTGLRVSDYQKIDGRDPGTTFAMETGQFYPNLLGLRGSEDLGNGLRVGFSLENRFNADSGTMCESGRLFDNQAIVTLSGEKWTVAAGRIEGFSSTMGDFDFAAPMDPFEGGWVETGGVNVFANIGLAANNAVVLQVRPHEGVTLAGAYSLAIDTEQKSYGDNQHYSALGASWKTDKLYAGLTYEAISRGNVAAERDQALKVGVNYDFGPLRAFAAWSYTKDHAWFGENLDSMRYMLGVTVPAGNGLIRASVQWLDGDSVTVTDAAGATADFSPERYVASIGYTYNLSKRTMLWSTYSWSEGRKSLDKDTDAGYRMAADEYREEANRMQLSVGMTHFF